MFKRIILYFRNGAYLKTLEEENRNLKKVSRAWKTNTLNLRTTIEFQRRQINVLKLSNRSLSGWNTKYRKTIKELMGKWWASQNIF